MADQSFYYFLTPSLILFLAFPLRTHPISGFLKATNMHTQTPVVPYVTCLVRGNQCVWRLSWRLIYCLLSFFLLSIFLSFFATLTTSHENSWRRPWECTMSMKESVLGELFVLNKMQRTLGMFHTLYVVQIMQINQAVKAVAFSRCYQTTLTLQYIILVWLYPDRSVLWLPLCLIRKCPPSSWTFISFPQFLSVYLSRTHIDKEHPFSSILLVQITSIKQMSSLLSLKLFSPGLGQWGYWWPHRKDSFVLSSLIFPYFLWFCAASHFQQSLKAS